MDITKTIDMENDGLNMAEDGEFLYIRRRRDMYKYRVSDMSLSAHGTVFKKDGKARSISVCKKYVFLTDFCDLYMLDKADLRTVSVLRLGADLSSDLGVVRFDTERAYISIRNGKMAIMDLSTRAVKSAVISDSSSWDFCVAGGRVYSGTVAGELIITDTFDMRLKHRNKVCAKNIYSAVYDNGTIYTVSQDTTIKAVSAETLEVVREKKKAVKGMVRILGIHNDSVVVADAGISLFDKNTLELRGRIDMPTGHFNKGALLCGDILFGSDYQSVYRLTL